MKTIIFNGPPRSGKDECCRILMGLHSFMPTKIADPLVEAVAKTLGLSKEQTDYYREAGKDEPIFNGLSFRDMLINYSEKVAIPRHGKNYWIEQWHENVTKHSHRLFSISDMGFDRELKYLDERYSANEICIVRLERPGKTFENDSRDYVYRFDYKIVNDGSLSDLYTAVDKVAKDFLQG